MGEEREFNPYAPPKAKLEWEKPLQGVWRTEPCRVPAVNGLLWWRLAARVVAARPGFWAAALGLATAVPTVLAVIGVDFDGDNDNEKIFFMFLFLFWPVLTGGIVNAAHKQQRGERIRLRDIFASIRSWLLFIGWICMGFLVMPLEVIVFMLLFLALDDLPLISAAAAVILVTGNIFIVAAAALHGDWPLRVIFRAGLVNMPAFLLNLLATILAICAVALLAGLIVSSRLTQSLTAPEYALVFDGALSLMAYAAFGALALVAYAAVRDMFYNEE